MPLSPQFFRRHSPTLKQLSG